MQDVNVKTEKKIYVPEFNKVELVSTIVKDPILTYSDNSGKPCFRCRVVWNKYFFDSEGNKKDKVGYINCCSWSRNAEKLYDKYKKGDTVLVEGSLEFYETNNDNGQKIERYNILIRRIQLLTRTVKYEIPENNTK
jgi:single stranded DNA-binding protein